MEELLKLLVFLAVAGVYFLFRSSKSRAAKAEENAPEELATMPEIVPPHVDSKIQGLKPQKVIKPRHNIKTIEELLSEIEEQNSFQAIPIKDTENFEEEVRRKRERTAALIEKQRKLFAGIPTEGGYKKLISENKEAKLKAEKKAKETKDEHFRPYKVKKTSQKNKPNPDALKSLFQNQHQIRNAVIISEIMNRKHF